MKIDLRILYGTKIVNVDDYIEIPEELYNKLNITSMERVHVCGRVFIDFDDEITLDLVLSGNYIMKCAISTDDVDCSFNINVSDKIAENTLKDEFCLDLFDNLWENIVLEIPLRVVKENAKEPDLEGEGWKLEKED